MAYKALVLDLDGTVLHAQRRQISPQCKNALQNLQSRGVRVIIATGRAPHACGQEVFDDFIPDYRICVNSACIIDKDRQIIHESRFTKEQVETLWHFAQKHQYPLSFSFEDSYYVYVNYEEYDAQYQKKWGAKKEFQNGSDGTRHLKSLPFGAFITLPRAQAHQFMAGPSGLTLVESMPGAFDVCKNGVHKAKGISVLLGQLGLTWQDIVTVGDGENDVEILQQAGCGVAMANACSYALQSANYVTASVQQDGVVQVVQNFFA